MRISDWSSDVCSSDLRDLAHLCVVGDSGSAKTTTLAQLAAMARSEWPHEPVALLAADRRLGAREQLRIISGMIGVPMVEPEPRESLADAVVRLGGSRRLFIDIDRKSTRLNSSH